MDLDGLARDALLLIGRHRAEGPHVVDAVGQFDQDDADIARHRQQHLAEVFRLLLFLGVPRNLAELGHTVDEKRHLGTEQLRDVFHRRAGVFTQSCKSPAQIESASSLSSPMTCDTDSGCVT